MRRNKSAFLFILANLSACQSPKSAEVPIGETPEESDRPQEYVPPSIDVLNARLDDLSAIEAGAISSRELHCQVRKSGEHEIHVGIGESTVLLRETYLFSTSKTLVGVSLQHDTDDEPAEELSEEESDEYWREAFGDWGRFYQVSNSEFYQESGDIYYRREEIGGTDRMVVIRSRGLLKKEATAQLLQRASELLGECANQWSTEPKRLRRRETGERLSVSDLVPS